MEQFVRILRIRIRIMVVMRIIEVVKSINLKPSLWMGRIMLNTIDLFLLICIGNFNFVFLEQVDFNQVLLYFLNIWKIDEKILYFKDPSLSNKVHQGTCDNKEVMVKNIIKRLINIIILLIIYSVIKFSF